MSYHFNVESTENTMIYYYGGLLVKMSNDDILTTSILYIFFLSNIGLWELHDKFFFSTETSVNTLGHNHFQERPYLS